MLFSVEGMDNIRRRVNSMHQNIIRASTEAVMDCALDLQEKSVTLAPVETGRLKADCKVKPSGENTPYVKADVGYSVIYAWYQHEGINFNHPLGGEAKFLEKPFEENRQKYIDYIKQRIEDSI